MVRMLVETKERSAGFKLKLWRLRPLKWKSSAKESKIICTCSKAASMSDIISPIIGDKNRERQLRKDSCSTHRAISLAKEMPQEKTRIFRIRSFEFITFDDHKFASFKLPRTKRTKIHVSPNSEYPTHWRHHRYKGWSSYWEERTKSLDQAVFAFNLRRLHRSWSLSDGR